MGKKIITLILSGLLICALVWASPVSANTVPPPPSIWFFLPNLPEGTVYVDLLIRLPEQDPYYVDTIRENIPGSFAQDAEILTWCEDDYRSYTFHYRDALSVFRVNANSSVRFFEGMIVDEVEHQVYRYDHADEILSRGKVRLAMLDAEGNILEITPLMELRPRGLFAYPSNIYHYDARSRNLKTQDQVFELSVIGYIGYMIRCVLCMVLTCFLELCVALPFKLVDRYGGLIGKTNVISQFLMHTSYLLLYRWVFWQYFYATLLLEILVFVGEYLYYRRTMEGVSRIRCMAYTVAANASSLVIGLNLMNMVRG